MKKVTGLTLMLVLLISMLGLPGWTAYAATTYSVSVKTDTYYEIYNVGGKKYLNVYDQKSANNTNVTLWARDYTPSEYFKFVSYSGAYMLVPKHATSKAVNAYGDYPANGANCCIWDKTYHSSQLFIPEYVPGSNAFILRLKYNTNLCLTAAGGSNGSNVYLANYNKSSYQLWTSNALSASGSGGSTGGSNSGKVEAAISWMEAAAANSSHGYDQTYRWGQYGDYDCSSAVITAWQTAGVPVKSSGATYTGNMRRVFLNCGFKDVTSSVNLSTGSGLQRGDVLLNTVNHTAMFAGSGKLVEASINEKGTISGGKPGDQTGSEFWKHGYYNYPWNYVLRYPESTVIAPSMSFSPSSVTVNPNESKTVTINFQGDGIYTLDYAISNSGVCSAAWGDVDYSKGITWLKITGNRPGTAQVTVRLLKKNGNSLLSKSFSVTVSNYNARISASPSSVNLNLASNSSQVVRVTLSGTFPDDAKLNVKASGIAKMSWISDAVRDNQAEAKVYAEEVGSGSITFRLIRGSEVLATTTINVNATAPSYTVSYDANGGKNSPGRQTKTYNKALTLTTQQPTRDGHLFKGWATSRGSSSVSYRPGAQYTGNQDLILYAVWEKQNSVTLSYHTGTHATMPSQTKTSSASSQTFIIPSTKLAREGYTFLGWSTSSSSTAASYQPGSSITISQNTTLYAVWKENTYRLRYDANGGSGAPAEQTVSGANPGTISNQIPQREGYSFLGWALDPAKAEIPDFQPGETITGITNDTVLYALWQEETQETGIYQLGYYYFVNCPANGFEEKECEEETCLFVVRSPEISREEYTFKGWSWLKNSTIPEFQPGEVVEIEENRTLYAVWAANEDNVRFADVREGQYYYDAVGWAVENSITSGTSATTFSPSATCTRAQAVTFLWRAAGCPEPTSASNPFSDVHSGDYYYKAVLWAVENGITSGTSSTTFSPNAQCSRAQIVTFLWRSAGSPEGLGYSSFSDVSSSAYYSSAVVWALENDITSGTGGNCFSPNVSCVRAQIVTFLYRFIS